MIKNGQGAAVAQVQFELPAEVAASSATVCGEFNDWSPHAQPLVRLEDGGFRAVIELPTGRRWRFRYLLDGHRWENDWSADDYILNGFGTHDSVVDLTADELTDLAAQAPHLLTVDTPAPVTVPPQVIPEGQQETAAAAMVESTAPKPRARSRKKASTTPPATPTTEGPSTEAPRRRRAKPAATIALVDPPAAAVTGVADPDGKPTPARRRRSTKSPDER